VHSFTESWKDVSRPWHAGVLWASDTRLAGPLYEALLAEGDLIVGANEPYAGQLEGDTLWQHGTRRGLAHGIIEIRQDLIRDLKGQTAWAQRLARIVRRLQSEPDLQLRLDDRTEPPPADRTRASAYLNGKASSSNEDRMPQIDDKTRVELEAAAFRKLVAHLRERTDVQNIDLMNLSGFCRNCLANWYQEAANASGLALTKDEAREIIYGMPYDEWRAKHQKEATPEQQAAFASAKPHSH